MKKIIESINVISLLICLSLIESSYVLGVIAVINLLVIILLEEGAGACQRNTIG